MIFDRDGDTTLVHQESSSVSTFLTKLREAYPGVKNDHLILNLFSLEALNANRILEFLPLSREHTAKGKSFVLVSDRLSYDEVPDEISLVPTIQEARDLIEMEEIERDLEL